MPDLAAAVPWFPFVGGLIGVDRRWRRRRPVARRPTARRRADRGAVRRPAHRRVPRGRPRRCGRRLRRRLDPRANVCGSSTIRSTASYGVAALCGSIVVRVACIASLGVAPAVAFACVVAAPRIARSAAVTLDVAVPVARPDGLGADYAASLSRPRSAAGVAAGVAIAALATGWWAAPFVATAIVAVVAVGWLTRRKLGGVTGDVLGTVEQVAECVVLVVASGLASRYALWW